MRGQNGWIRMQNLAAALLAALTLNACSRLELGVSEPRLPSLRVADAALMAGMPQVALRVADLALARNPHDAQALMARGDALYAMHQWDAALVAYRSATASAPQEPDGHIGLGRILIHSDPRKAEVEFTTALKYAPENAIALNDLGIAKDLQGRNTEAQADYYRALAVSSDKTEVEVNLGLSLALSGAREKAAFLLRTLAADPGAVRVWGPEISTGLRLSGSPSLANEVLAGPIDPASPQWSGMRATTSNSAIAVSTTNKATETKPVLDMEADSDPALITAPRQPVLSTVPPSRKGLELAKNASPFAVSGEQGHEQEESPEPASRQIIKDHETSIASSDVPVPVVESSGKHTTKIESSAGGTPFVQVGSLGSEAGAVSARNQLESRRPDFFEDRTIKVVVGEVNGKTYWRLRTFGFSRLDQATELCNQMKASGVSCWSGRML